MSFTKKNVANGVAGLDSNAKILDAQIPGTNSHATIDTHLANLTKHRLINDAGTTTTELFSASEIISRLAAKLASVLGDTSPQLGGDLEFNDKTANLMAVRQITDASPATTTTHTFNYTNGDMQQITCPAAGTLTIAFSNFPTGDVAGFIIDLVNGGNCTITWPTMIKAGGAFPTFTTAGTDRMIVVSDKDGVLALLKPELDIK